MEVQDVHVESASDLPIPGQDRVHGVQHIFATLDIVNLTEVFAQRARVMQSVPRVIRGAFTGSGRLWPIQFWPIHFWPAHLASPILANPFLANPFL